VLPAPQPDKVVTMFLEKREVRAVIVLFWYLGADWAGTKPIMKVIPNMRAGQVDRLLRTC
jgi:hypothetical protein